MFGYEELKRVNSMILECNKKGFYESVRILQYAQAQYSRGVVIRHRLLWYSYVLRYVSIL